MQVEDNLKRKDVFALVVILIILGVAVWFVWRVDYLLGVPFPNISVLKYASIYMIIGVFMGLLIINSVFAVGKVPNDYL